MYTQCRLKRPKKDEDGTVISTTISTAWIPQKFAKKGKHLKMKIDGSWQYGWYVADTFATKTEKYVLELPYTKRSIRRVKLRP